SGSGNRRRAARYQIWARPHDHRRIPAVVAGLLLRGVVIRPAGSALIAASVYLVAEYHGAQFPRHNRSLRGIYFRAVPVLPSALPASSQYRDLRRLRFGPGPGPGGQVCRHLSLPRAADCLIDRTALPEDWQTPWRFHLPTPDRYSDRPACCNSRRGPE